MLFAFDRRPLAAGLLTLGTALAPGSAAPTISGNPSVASAPGTGAPLTRAPISIDGRFDDFFEVFLNSCLDNALEFLLNSRLDDILDALLNNCLDNFFDFVRNDRFGAVFV